MKFPCRALLIPFAAAAVATILCYAATGASLGLIFGGVAFALILAPPLVLAHDSKWQRAFALAGVIDGVGVIWFVAIFASPLSFLQWLQCYLLLAATVFAFALIAISLRSFRVEASLACAIPIVISLLWLSWPLWLSPWLGEQIGSRIVEWLARLHPLLSMNGVLQADFGVWTQSRVLYNLTTLGQDVPYSFPSTVAAAVIFHSILAGACWMVARSGK